MANKTSKTSNGNASSSSSSHKRVVVPREVRDSFICKVTGRIEEAWFHTHIVLAGNFFEWWERGLIYAGCTVLMGLCGYMVVKGVAHIVNSV
eukprot:GILK01013061.1.p1 GENE.GILK01013061.1~~GILK01013061.1.p1  ORF type:complete len:105 (+),score=2.07 GILK01013061.1:40-315(+)